jgi:glycosyltransferase involved in cell wall biosynthesis
MTSWYSNINKNIEVICLAEISSNLFGRINAYNQLLSQRGNRNNVVSLSMCFSADILNLFCKNKAIIFSSIRGNLFKNYKYDYGIFGSFLAFFHYFILNFFDYVSVMSRSMKSEIFPLSLKNVYLVRNFLDEAHLEKHKYKVESNRKNVKFIFIGSLSLRKQPVILLHAVKQLLSEGFSVRLDIVGTGKLYSVIKTLVKDLDLGDKVTIHGHLDNPYSLLCSSDVLLLPSLSEGMSRASMEALYLGVPCILRNVDANHEYITEGVNGELFNNHEELLEKMRLLIYKNYRTGQVLLPYSCRQQIASKKILKIAELQ